MPEQRLFNWVDLPDHARPFGGQIVIDNLRANGCDVGDFNGNIDRILLISLYWCEDIYKLIVFRIRNKIKNVPIIAGGNYASSSPNAVLPFVSGVYLGDADNWDGADMSNIVTENKRAKLSICEIGQIKLTMEAKAVAKDSFDIIELSRGCKYKCLYCQYSWMKPYRENDREYIIKNIQDKNTSNRLRLTCADLFQYNGFDEILEQARMNKIQIVNQDGALNSIKYLNETNIEKTQRFGIDGMSERLRKLVNKNITNDFLIESILKYNILGVGRILAYNIFGYPTENKGDFEDWIKLLNRLIMEIKPPMTIVISWNAFIPMPLTPLQWTATSYRKDIRDFRIMQDVRERAKKRGINILDMPQSTGGLLITQRALAIRGSKKTANLIYNVALNKKISEQQIMKEFHQKEGYDLHTEYPADIDLPWDKFIDYDKNKLLKIYQSKIK